VGLSLVVGPAHAGKVALLLERFVALRDAEPWLVVPNRADVEVVERDLIRRTGGLVGGRVSTFEELFQHLARDPAFARPVVGDAARAVLLRRAVAGQPSEPERRLPGYAESVGAAIGDLDAGLMEPANGPASLAPVHAAYRELLEVVGLWDRHGQRRAAVERLTGAIDAWDGRPVLAYGFEDLTGAEWRLLEALAARGEVHVSLPYEPGRTAFASLARTADDLAALASSVERLAPRSYEHLPASLAQLERHLFEDAAPRVPLDGAVRFLEGAGRRATLELVAAEILELAAQGVALEEVAVVVPSTDRARRGVEAAFGALGVPAAVEGPLRFGQTALGAAFLRLLRFAWGTGGRGDLFAFLRSPFSGLPRHEVDFLEGRLRGRGVTDPARVEDTLLSLRGGKPLPLLDRLRDAEEPVSTCADALRALAANAHGLEPATSDERALDLRTLQAALHALDDLQRLAALGCAAGREDVLHVLERTSVPGRRPGGPGRVAVLDLLRVRTRRFDTVFVLGLEQGSLPRRGSPTPLLDDDERRRLDDAHGSRLVRPDTASRDRYLFLTACTRARRRLVLVREAATDDGSPREPSPFWEEAQALFDPDDVRRATVRRPLSRLTWTFHDAPTERERLRALSRLAAADASEARSVAAANGWERRLDRALAAWHRGTCLTEPAVVGSLAERASFRVTDLERMATCSAAWFVERLLSPGEIDRTVDAKVRGQVAHTALQRFYSRLPSAIPGAERVTPENLEQALVLIAECVDDAVTTGLRFDVTDVVRRELRHGLRRDLEQLVRQEAASSSRFVPRRLELSFSEYDLGDGVAVSGKIDRVDADPWSARGIVVDYKSGSAPTARQIREELRVQVPLYMLVVRDELGLEPVGGVYAPIGGGRRPRGMLLAGDGSVDGFARDDYLDPDAFAGEIEHARTTAVALAERIRAGDVRHDPRDGECPSWCDLWRTCRKDRP
jgi:RecB family exonuclease